MQSYRQFLLFLCVLAVGVVWAAGFGFLSFMLSMTRVPVASTIALVIAFGTVPASWLCARLLSRSRMRWWPPITALFAGIAFVVADTLLWSWDLVDHTLTGPVSPTGLTTFVDVHDAHAGLSADFYSDVRVLDRDGIVVAQWKDRCGQDYREGPRSLRDSMRWTSPTTLEFTACEGPQHLDVH
jgi:hypothetical protein